MSRPRRYLCTALPLLSFERQRHGHPALACEQPHVLTTEKGNAAVLVAVNPVAARQGLRPGLALSEARAAVENLIADRYDEQADRRLLNHLADWATRFSPMVEGYESSALVLDIHGCAHLFGGETSMARRVVEGLAHLGFTARAAVADTVRAAKALAALAADPIIVAAPGDHISRVAALGIAALNLGTSTETRLTQVGLTTIGDLLRTPRATLAARFGPQVSRRLDQLIGTAHEGVCTRCPQPSLRAGRDFEDPLRNVQLACGALDDLLYQLFAQLRSAGRALQTLRCLLTFEVGTPVSLTVRLARPTHDQRHAAALLYPRVERVDFERGARALVLEATETVARRPGQGRLFEPAYAEEGQFDRLLNQLIDRLGPAAVRRAELRDDHQPEASYRETSDFSNVADLRATNEFKPAKEAGERPIRVFQRPVPIRVIALVPHGPPTWLAWQDQEHIVAAADGPERIETGWWRGPDVRRDYLRVMTESGTQLWVFRDADTGQWYLHGLFA